LRQAALVPAVYLDYREARLPGGSTTGRLDYREVAWVDFCGVGTWSSSEAFLHSVAQAFRTTASTQVSTAAPRARSKVCWTTLKQVEWDQGGHNDGGGSEGSSDAGYGSLRW